MSTRPDNIRANFAGMDFTQFSIDIDRIAAMTSYRAVTKDKVPIAPEWDQGRPCMGRHVP